MIADTFAPDSRRVIAPYPVYQPVHEGADTVDTVEDTVSYFDAATGEEIGRIEVGLWTYHDDGYYPDMVEVSGDGTKLAVGSTKAGLGRVFDIDTGYPVAELRWPKFPRISSSFNVELSPDFGTATVWRDDLRLTDKGRTTIDSVPLQLVDTSSGAVTHELSDGGLCRPNWNGTPVAFSPDGSRLISACQDESGAVIWDIATGARQLRLEGRATINSLRFVANGSRVAAVGNDGTLTIYDAHSGDVVNSFNWRGGVTYGVQWSADESRLLVCDDNWLRLVRAEDGREVARIRFPRPAFATFSPDQTRLLALQWGVNAHVFDARPAADRFAEEQRYAAAAEQGRQSAGEALAAAGQRIQSAAARIRADAGLTQEVRRAALDALFQECSRRRASVLALFEKQVFADSVVAAIKADSASDEGVRADMVEIARRRGDNPVPLDRAAWKRVTRPNETAADYELGLRAAERAVAELPTLDDLLEMESHQEQNEYWHWECDRFRTLGVALYRNGKLEAALQTLSRYVELRKKLGYYEDPTNVAFLAMSQFKLGQIDDAKASLARLRELMRDTRHAANQEYQAFFAEVADLIEDPAPSPASAHAATPE